MAAGICMAAICSAVGGGGGSSQNALHPTQDPTPNAQINVDRWRSDLGNMDVPVEGLKRPGKMAGVRRTKRRNPELYEAHTEHPTIGYGLPRAAVADNPCSAGYDGWACEARQPGLGCTPLFDQIAPIWGFTRRSSRRILAD